MAVSTSRLQTTPMLTRPKLTTYQWILIAAGIVVATVLIGGALLYLMGPGDEQPIRVRNGSMDLELLQAKTQPNKWEDNGGDGWSQSEGKSSGLFYVKVLSANPDGCASPATANGRFVTISYTDGVTVTFRHAKKSFYSSPKTKVDEKDEFTNPSALLLRHGTPGDPEHYISRIRVSGGTTDLKCKFRNAAELTEIMVCPAQHSLCQ
jgi:hypothetical protein